MSESMLSAKITAISRHSEHSEESSIGVQSVMDSSPNKTSGPQSRLLTILEII